MRPQRKSQLSRMAVARYLAAGLVLDRERTVRQAAAWLMQAGPRQAPYLVRDIARALAAQGYVAAWATTAHKLDRDDRDRLTAHVKALTGAREVELADRTDAALIGGIKLETPDGISDQTVVRRLHLMSTNVTGGPNA